MPGLKQALKSTAVGTVAIAILAGAGPAFALSNKAASPFGDIAAISDSQLSGMRGGFSIKTPLGVMNFDFGVTIRLRAEFPAAAQNAVNNVFEMTTQLTFNGKGKLSGFETTTQGTLPGNTQVTVTPGTNGGTTGGGTPAGTSGGTGGTTGGTPAGATGGATGGTSGGATGGTTPSNTGGGTPAVNTGQQPVTTSGATIAVNNPNLSAVQQIKQDQIAIISQLSGNNASLSQSVVANVVVKNFSQIMTNMVRNGPRLGRISRSVGAMSLR